MPRAFSSISFTDSVKAAQNRYGSRDKNMGLEMFPLSMHLFLQQM